MLRVPAIALVLLLAPALAPSAAALPTPGVFCDAAETLHGRVFPEALDTNDFVSYAEARCGIDLLMRESPGWLQVDVVGESVGWPTVTGEHDTFEVFVVRVSNYESGIPVEDRIRIVFQLSIHGNEKGGREGGLRVIEDLVRGIGHAETYPEMRRSLDHMELLFVFPQPDGWTHEELEYRAACADYFRPVPLPTGGCLDSQNFVRTNGNGVDVNRQWPTVGWVRQSHEPMSQPEATALVAYLKQVTNIKYASDIHGMLNPADGGLGLGCSLGLLDVPEDPHAYDPTCFAAAVEDAQGHYVLTMLPAGRQELGEMTASTQLAELVKERLNSDPYFAEWSSIPNTPGGAWGGKFNDWGTVWDTIGYTDSGFTSDWYAQDHGLNAPGVDFELAYNHVTFDNYYPGPAARMNAYHVEIVREIVRAFMDAANQDIEPSIDAKGRKTAYLDNPTVVTNADAPLAVGWAARNPLDDAWDTGTRIYRASPNDYFVELHPFVKDGDAAGVLDSLAPRALATRLADYDNLVVAGSAYRSIADDAAAKDAIGAWVEAGGNLVLTDESMRLLEDLGLARAGSVDVLAGYAGATNFVDRDHPLAQGIRGLARETYEPVPLGFPVDELSAPNWYVSASGFSGDVVGVAGEGQGARANASYVNFGAAKLGSGTVSFLGSLLPDPLAGDAVLYGLDSYATTYTGNQLLRNMLGWDLRVAQTPVAPQTLAGRSAPAPEDTAGIPAPAVGLALVSVAALALVRRRK